MVGGVKVVNFIICDDNRKDREKVEKIVDKFMMKNQLHYEKHLFDDYDDTFLKLVKKKIAFKVYILDIEAPSMSGIDVARIIRNRDVNSVLIFLTGHNELAETVIRNDFLFLSFINKFDNCEERLINALGECLKILGVRKNLRFKDNGILYTIAFDDILYITRDSVDRKCIIKTDYSEFRVNKTLTDMENMVSDAFTRTHKSCIVNLKRVVSVNKQHKIIKFDDGSETDLISKTYKVAC